ncbi:MAG: phosphoribosylformylglycinamidine synthase subunit PurL [Gemmataceae bacterium]|nr:phosphoribosylformylglycinamidine synthase subunit PurL [Gemmataceae bacterium]
MIWEIEIKARGIDLEKGRVNRDFHLFRPGQGAIDPVTSSTRGFLIEGNINQDEAKKLSDQLLTDPVVETGRVSASGSAIQENGAPCLGTVLLNPGVMDPAALSILAAAKDLGIPLDAVRSFRRYFGPPCSQEDKTLLFRKVLANEAIEMVVEGPVREDHLSRGKPYTFHKLEVKLLELADNDLNQLSRDMTLSLNLEEMRTIQGHYQKLGRNPADVELETIAQTWSEHCSHKTLKGRIDFQGKQYGNLLKETIFEATRSLRQSMGKDDWCVSVFEDNAGVIRFDERHHLCFKVETHNRPSAIEPYAGANTGIGGVIRDPLGTGLGAKPVCNTDVFCFAPLDTPPESLPEGILHPVKIMTGVVSGVRDYGNRIGIPTINGAVSFHERYLGNPLVFCGTAGLIPVDKAFKKPLAGDLIVVVGGRTGRDGIHGATFSSAELHTESEKISGGAVQIGNAIEEKKVVDAILKARDEGLYNAITDCGAGGFSSAVGEMGEHLGARVDLDKAPLKYDGLSYTEIWISESQERMILAVTEEKWARLHEVCAGEGAEAAVLGVFEKTGRLQLFFQGNQVANLDLEFLHNGRPNQIRSASWSPPAEASASPILPLQEDLGETLRKLLAAPNIRSKEWIIRQYDHEVQGGSVIKPLVGVKDDGPSDASVVNPCLDSFKGFAVGCGLLPDYGDLDPYAMAACSIDEAVRNVVAVGGNPERLAILDNFCWGNTDRPEVLGSLVLAAEACKEFALAYRTPFISGKDSLKNEFHSSGKNIVIPPTLLISAMALVEDIRECVTMDLKQAGNRLFLLGRPQKHLGGSQYSRLHGMKGSRVPRPDPKEAIAIHRSLHQAIRLGLVRSCHDVSEGGIAVTLAEMAFSGELGADITGLIQAGEMPDPVLFFGESPACYVLEVESDKSSQLTGKLAGLPLWEIGEVRREKRLRLAGVNGEWKIWAQLDQLKKAWQEPLLK